jgi:hypothetical protein
MFYSTLIFCGISNTKLLYFLLTDILDDGYHLERTASKHSRRKSNTRDNIIEQTPALEKNKSLLLKLCCSVDYVLYQSSLYFKVWSGFTKRSLFSGRGLPNLLPPLPLSLAATFQFRIQSRLAASLCMTSSHVFRGLPIGLPSHINFSGHNWNGTTNVPITSHSRLQRGRHWMRSLSTFFGLRFLYSYNVQQILALRMTVRFWHLSETGYTKFSVCLYLFLSGSLSMVPLCYWRDRHLWQITVSTTAKEMHTSSKKHRIWHFIFWWL